MFKLNLNNFIVNKNGEIISADNVINSVVFLTQKM